MLDTAILSRFFNARASRSGGKRNGQEGGRNEKVCGPDEHRCEPGVWGAETSCAEARGGEGQNLMAAALR